MPRMSPGCWTKQTPGGSRRQGEGMPRCSQGSVPACSKLPGQIPAGPQARGAQEGSCFPSPSQQAAHGEWARAGPCPPPPFLCRPQLPLGAEDQPQGTQPPAPQALPKSEGERHGGPSTLLPWGCCRNPASPQPSPAGAGASLGRPERKMERDGLKAEPGARGQRTAQLCHRGCTARPGCSLAASPPALPAAPAQHCRGPRYKARRKIPADVFPEAIAITAGHSPHHLLPVPPR